MSSGLLVLLIALAGGVGSATRFCVDEFVARYANAELGWGTWAVNTRGSFLLGLVTGLGINEPFAVVLSVGFFGGYTTFSAASVRTVNLAAKHRYVAALAHGPGMLIGCSCLAVAGVFVATNW